MKNDNHELHLKLFASVTKNRKLTMWEKRIKKDIEAHKKYLSRFSCRHNHSQDLTSI